MTITLFVGDNNQELADFAKQHNPAAFLVNTSNYKFFLSTEYSKDITVYSSFSDLPKITSTDAVFFEVLKKADNIFYHPPLKWSDHSNNFSWNRNQTITEYLVNFDYLNRVMSAYGFEIISREEAQDIGLPDGSGLFSELFMNMLDEITKNKFKAKEYDQAPYMTAYEKKISFINKYFIETKY